MIKPRSSLFILLGISAVVLVSACKRKAIVAPAAPPPVEVPVAAPAAPVPDAAPASAQIVTTRASNDAAYNREMEQTLNDFLGDYIKQNKRIPRDIHEMVSLKIITSIPPVTGGKKWVIDQRTGKISAQ